MNDNILVREVKGEHREYTKALKKWEAFTGEADYRPAEIALYRSIRELLDAALTQKWGTDEAINQTRKDLPTYSTLRDQLQPANEFKGGSYSYFDLDDTVPDLRGDVENSVEKLANGLLSDQFKDWFAKDYHYDGQLDVLRQVTSDLGKSRSGANLLADLQKPGELLDPEHLFFPPVDDEQPDVPIRLTQLEADFYYTNGQFDTQRLTSSAEVVSVAQKLIGLAATMAPGFAVHYARTQDLSKPAVAFSKLSQLFMPSGSFDFDGLETRPSGQRLVGLSEHIEQHVDQLGASVTGVWVKGLNAIASVISGFAKAVKFYDDPSIKNGIDAAAALTGAFFSIADHIDDLVRDGKLSVPPKGRVVLYGTYAAPVLGALDVFSSAKNGYDSYTSGDYSVTTGETLATIGATALLAHDLAAAATLATTGSAAAASAWFTGGITLLIFIGFVIATQSVDSPLESWVQNCFFGKNYVGNSSNWSDPSSRYYRWGGTSQYAERFARQVSDYRSMLGGMKLHDVLVRRVEDRKNDPYDAVMNDFNPASRDDWAHAAILLEVDKFQHDSLVVVKLIYEEQTSDYQIFPVYYDALGNASEESDASSVASSGATAAEAYVQRYTNGSPNTNYWRLEIGDPTIDSLFGIQESIYGNNESFDDTFIEVDIVPNGLNPAVIGSRSLSAADLNTNELIVQRARAKLTEDI